MKACLRTEIWKALHNWFFWSAVVIGTILSVMDVVEWWQLSKPIYEKVLTSPNVYKRFMAMSIAQRFIAITGNMSTGGRVFYTVWPVLAALPFGWSYWKEKDSGVSDQIMIRAGKKQYAAAKLTAMFLSGGLALAIPVTVNLLTVAQIYRTVQPNVLSEVDIISHGFFLSRLFYSHPFLFCLVWCGMTFLWGGVTSCLCLIVGHKPKYMVISTLTPLVLYTAIEMAISFLYSPRNIEISPLHLVNSGTFSPNPGWVIFPEMIFLLLLACVAGYGWIVKNEL